MTPAQAAVCALVCEEVAGVIETAEHEAIAYARGYFEHLSGGGPRPQTRMHPDIAAAVRDVVLDQAQAARMVPARYR